MPDPDVPTAATVHGFRIKPTGTHLSRTIMVSDFRTALSSRTGYSTQSQYRAAIVGHNLLGKSTTTAARMTFDRLCELYAFDPELRIFRALTDMWDSDPGAQPQLALLCATARDPILRAVTPFVLERPVGETVAPQRIAEEADRQFPGKFRPSSLQRLGRNVASSWTQAGLFKGRQKKTRIRAGTRPVAVAYALLLGDLCGSRGHGLFSTLWARMLDAPAHELRRHAEKASREGWIDYRAAGDVTEVTFRRLMREEAEVSS